MLALYQDAAATCPGLPWTVLAAIGTFGDRERPVDPARGPLGAERGRSCGRADAVRAATFAEFDEPIPPGVNPPDIYDPVAKDAVCGMQVETRHAPATLDYHGARMYFCSEHCRDRFAKNLDRYLSATATDHTDEAASEATDPICGMTIEPRRPAAHRHTASNEFYFCSLGCAEKFDRCKTPADPSISRPVAFHRREPT